APSPIEDGKVQFLVPVAMEQCVFAEMRFQSHPQTLQEPYGRLVGSTDPREDAMKGECVEDVVHCDPAGLDRVALAAVARIENETQLRLGRGCICPDQ